ncbi:MAG: signal transducing kinase of the PAK, variant 2 [Marteilia pararefringens]
MPQKSRSINLKNLTVGSDNSASTKIQKGDDQTGSESSITKKTIFSNIHSKNIFRKINNSQKKTSLLNDQRSVPNTTNKKDKNYGTAKSSPGISSIFKLYNEQMTQINTSRPQIPAITRPVVNSNYKMSDATCLTNLKHMCVMKDPIVEMTKNGANLTPQISASSIPVTTNNENKNNQPSSMELTPNLRLYHTISYSNRSEKFGMIQLPLHVQQNLKSVVDELLVFRLGSSHPNNVLLQMRDCYFHENSVYFITEYVVYEHNLQKWSESSKIMHTNSQLSLVIAECFKSLVFIYQKLIIHRQIRASNFVITNISRS